MDDGSRHPEERAEKHDDVPRSSVAERERSVEPHDEDAGPDQVYGSKPVDPASDVVRYVKDEQEDREERGHGQRDIAMHLNLLIGPAGVRWPSDRWITYTSSTGPSYAYHYASPLG